MSANAIARTYGNLTPEERFRLILAASGRGDVDERKRLGRASRRITLSMEDHAPYAHAFNDLSIHVFLDLLAEAAEYLCAFGFTVNDCQAGGAADETYDEAEECDGARDAEGDAEGDFTEADTFMAIGFVLRTKADGWKLFCERLNIPPFLLWQMLPGFDRVRQALALTEKAAFVPEGFLRWLNCVRPAGKPELTEVPLTVEGVADANAKVFRKCVEWWSGGT